MRGLRIALTLLAATVLAIAGVTPAVAQDEPRFSLSTSVNYFVGDYGTDKDTTFVYVPVTLGVRPIDRLWLSVTVPYLYQSNQNVVLTGGGAAPRKSGKGKFGQPGDDTTEQGIGDVLFKVTYVVLEEKDFIPEIMPYVKIKFPTADEDRGLGTGEFDESIGIELNKTLVGSLVGYVGVAYTFIGDPPGTDLHDSFAWSVGVAYGVIPSLSVFAFLEGATAVVPGEDDPLEIRAGVEYRLTRSVKLTGTVTRGLSNGSADWGLSAGVSARF
jgi:hypothetical protein